MASTLATNSSGRTATARSCTKHAMTSAACSKLEAVKFAFKDKLYVVLWTLLPPSRSKLKEDHRRLSLDRLLDLCTQGALAHHFLSQGLDVYASIVTHCMAAKAKVLGDRIIIVALFVAPVEAARGYSAGMVHVAHSRPLLLMPQTSSHLPAKKFWQKRQRPEPALNRADLPLLVAAAIISICQSCDMTHPQCCLSRKSA